MERIPVILTPRRGTISSWSHENPILLRGEMGLEFPDTGVGTGIGNIKIGDGVNRYNDLPYFIKGINEDHTATIAGLLVRIITLEANQAALTTALNLLTSRVQIIEENGVVPPGPPPSGNAGTYGALGTYTYGELESKTYQELMALPPKP